MPIDYETDSKTMARDIVQRLSTYVNQGRSHRLLIDALYQEHRTLQQQMTGVMVLWFVHLSLLDENQYDPRNEYSVKLAKALRPVLEENNAVFGDNRVRFPMI